MYVKTKSGTVHKKAKDKVKTKCDSTIRYNWEALSNVDKSDKLCTKCFTKKERTKKDDATKPAKADKPKGLATW